MMNQDLLQGIEYLREKANVSYEEAMNLLERCGGDVMAALVELEKQGSRLAQATGCCAEREARRGKNANETKEKAASLFQKAKQSRLVIDKKNSQGERETVANVSALAVAGVTVFLPHFMALAVLFTLLTGHQVKLETKGEEV